MFFDIGWPEFLLIGVVALVVIGPKDLPAALRVAGYWVRKARSLSREFHSSVEQMMREAELHEVQAELRKVTELNLDHEANKIMDPATDPAAGPQAPAAIPDHFDTTPAPLIEEPVPLAAPAEPVAAEALPELEEPELPLTVSPSLPGMPAVEPEPARAAEPSKP
jgi:sec-independent protein translocase protein TatB